MEFEIRNRISLAEVNQLVNDVVESLFSGKDYRPANKDVVVNLYLVSYFCPDYFAGDIDIEKFYSDYLDYLKTLNDDDNNVTELGKILDKIISNEQTYDISLAIGKAIEFEKEKIIHKNSLNEELSVLVSKVTEIVDKMSGTINPETIEKLMPAFENIGKLTDINQDAVVKEIVSSINPVKKKTANKNIKIAK